ncbi:MAG: acyl-CoA dehydrogenase [Alphaproteobacteria bacterium]|nr:acyl-CoA dehydrogenase [Alphaproteobacteria bacterium]
MDLDGLKAWVGRRDSAEDTAALAPVAALSASLDRADPPPRSGDPLPPLWHWLYFLEAKPASELGPDGHPKRGGFLPPVPLPRRMWAGSRLTFLAPIPLGAPIRRDSEILKVEVKEGRSGTLVFVTVRHRVMCAGAAAIEEEHDIVYRNSPKPGDAAPAAKPEPGDGTWSRRLVPDPVLLFRYSALTFNGHRIHYDHPYVTTVEGYPGLVVHGPLQATLMLDLVRRQRPAARVRRFSFRALQPVFADRPLGVGGRPAGSAIALWVANDSGHLAMDGEAVLAEG